MTLEQLLARWREKRMNLEQLREVRREERRVREEWQLRTTLKWCYIGAVGTAWWSVACLFACLVRLVWRGV